MKYIDKVILCLGLFAVIFIVAMTIIFCVKGSTPDTLILCVLSGSGFEALCCCVITCIKKKAHIKEEEHNE